MTSTSSTGRAIRSGLDATFATNDRVAKRATSELLLGWYRVRYPGLSAVGRVRLGRRVVIDIARTGQITLRDCTIFGDSGMSASDGAVLDFGGAYLGKFSVVAARREIIIGAGTMVAAGVTIRDHNHDRSAPLTDNKFHVAAVHIGTNVWIAANCVVLPGVTIGDDATIGAGAVVTKDIPAGTTAVGIPARVIDPREGTTAKELRQGKDTVAI